MGVMASQCIATFLLFFLLGVSATNHSVGGPSGWDLSSNVQVWSAANLFHVGDILVFKYTPVHDVLEVNELDYIKCRTINPINVDNSGDTVVRLTQPGAHYFISGRNEDCTMGLKFSIDVLPQANEPLAGRIGYIFPTTLRRLQAIHIPRPLPIPRPRPILPPIPRPWLRRPPFPRPRFRRPPTRWSPPPPRQFP